ncbi:MAG: hypothetical protein MUO40_12590, partial [Anaerolineaceae bacterium]|nr:hypothetical protein [Anaerolineaceae bacterium]
SSFILLLTAKVELRKINTVLIKTGMSMSDEDLNYKPAILQRGFLKSWWIIILGMIIGSLIGMVISYSLKPVYETTFIIIADVRITKSEEITEIMLDAAINHIGDLAYNPIVIDKLVSVLEKENIFLNFDSILEMTSIERRLNANYLKVRGENPEVITKIANTWGLILYGDLLEGYKNSIIAQELTTYQETLELCLIDEDEAGCGTYCGLDQLALKAEINRLSGEIAEANNQSLGLYSELSVSQYQEADIPSRPAYYEQRILISVGTLIGLLIALLVLEVWVPRKKVVD